MKHKHRFLILIACLLWQHSPGQEFADLNWRSLKWQDGLPEYTIQSSLIQDRIGRLWIGSDRGLFRYDGYTLTTYQSNPSDPSSLPELNIQALFEDSDGHIWVCMRNAGIAILDPVTNTFDRKLPVDLGGQLPAERIWNITEDSDKNLWIGTDKGLLKYNHATDTFDFFVSDFSQFGKNGREYFNAIRRVKIHPLDTNRLLVGTRGGLLEFNKFTEVFTYIPMPYSSRDELGMDSPHYLIMDMCITHDTILWCATWSGGLLSYHLITGEWQRFQHPNSDPKDDVGFAIRVKSQDELWYAHRLGFAVFNVKEGKSNYLETNSETTNSIISGPIYDMLVLRDGTLVVAGATGLSICENFPVSTDRRDDGAPHISEILLNGQSMVVDTNISYLQTLTLEPGENNLTFIVSYPAFLNPEGVRFRYKLEGHDANWIETGTRTVEYQGLSGGNYIFRYQARREDDSWRDGLTAPRVRIELSLWEHPLFISSGLVLFVITAWGLHRSRILRLNKRQALETEFNQRLAAMEMSVLRAQMNPHFMFNSLNSIKNYILKKKTDEASTYLTKFSQLMRAVLQNSQSTLIPLHDELRALSLYIELEALRFEGEFTWQIKLDPELNTESLAIPPLLIQPYVENAIRHGLLEKASGPRELTINIAPAGDAVLSMIIQDNGIGRVQSAKRQQQLRRSRSHGMQITSDRIALIMKTMGIHAEVNVEDLYHADGSSAGTKVEIQIPQLTVEKTKQSF